MCVMMSPPDGRTVTSARRVPLAECTPGIPRLAEILGSSTTGGANVENRVAEIVNYETNIIDSLSVHVAMSYFYIFLRFG